MSYSNENDPEFQSVKLALHSRLTRREKVRKNSEGVHASHLTREDQTFCPREVRIIDDLDEVPHGKYINASLGYTFSMGRKLEELFFEVMEDLLVGTWVCYNCGRLHKFCRKPLQCKHCGGKRSLRYREEVFLSQESGIVSSVDCLLDVGEPRLVITELKSLDKEIYKKLNQPMSEHRDRTNIYMKVIATSGDPRAKYINTDYARVLYLGKCYGMKHEADSPELKVIEQMSPFKEFVVPRDDMTVHTYWTKAKVVKKARKLGLFPKGVCATAVTKRAMDCPVCDKCFSGQYPRHDVTV